MSEQDKKDDVYSLLIEEETGELKPKTEKILRAIFDNFDADKDGKWNMKELQDFATATNGRPFEDSVIEEIIESFEVDKENNLLYSGFYQMYYMQTVSEPEETLKDFKKHGYDDNLELVASHSGILRVTIHECRNLGSHHKMNPHATIKINGIDRFQTPIFKYTANPKFERSFEILVLDKTEVHVHVSVLDGTRSLGQWSAYLMEIFKQQETNEYWWDLSQARGINARLRLSVQWRPVVLSGLSQMGGSGIYAPPIGVVRLSIWSAKYGDNIKRDPYIRIRAGTQIRAKTETLDNTLSPEWGEFHYIPIHSLNEDLILKLMEATDSGKDKSLGSTVLQLKDLVEEQGEQNFVARVNKLERESVLTGQKAGGTIHYTAEFLPSLNMTTLEGARYTPDDIIDLHSYNSGVITVKIHELKLKEVAEVYCQLLVDSLEPQYRTEPRKGKTLAFGEVSDAFVKDAGFSRVAIEVKYENKQSRKSDENKVGYWYESCERLIRHIQKRVRSGQSFDEDEGVWYDLIGGAGEIRLSFEYVPLINYKMNPDESLENQGNLTVTLLSAQGLKAADKSGTSDPYVKFTINGEVVHKSTTLKKTLNPVWHGETFQVPIVSRVTTSFRIEVFDYNQLSGDIPLGSGGISLRGDRVESFCAHDWDVPLDGMEGVDQSKVRIRLKWDPQLLARQKTHTSFMRTATRRVTTKMGATAFNWSQPLPKAITVPTRMTVNIVEARGLAGDESKMNPMATLSIDHTTILKSKKVKKTNQPLWNESIALTQLDGEKVVEIKVKDMHTFHSEDIGTFKTQRSTRNRKSATKIVSADDSDEDLNSLSDEAEKIPKHYYCELCRPANNGRPKRFLYDSAATTSGTEQPNGTVADLKKPMKRRKKVIGGEQQQQQHEKRSIKNHLRPLITETISTTKINSGVWDYEDGKSYEPSYVPAKVKYPHAKMTLSEMNKRTQQIMEYINKLKQEANTCITMLPASPLTPIPLTRQEEKSIDMIEKIKQEILNFQRKFGIV
ncbi:hypothetical protein G6F28_008119 [Rhizopus arrhizus]|nr:hypothetical protein G6F28_008119 [Rhizopus arrhizus]